MNIVYFRLILEVRVIRKQIDIFSDPYCEGYFGKYCENFDGKCRSGVWTNVRDNTVYYNMWINFIRRRT